MKTISALLIALGCLLVGCEKKNLTEESELSSPSVNSALKSVLSASTPMPISIENCNALWEELIEIRRDRAVVSKPESFPGEFLVVDGFSAIENLGFDPDKTIRNFILLLSNRNIHNQSSCAQMHNLIPRDMEKAISMGLVSERTRHVFEVVKRYDYYSFEETPALVVAVEKCQAALSSPCTIQKLMDYKNKDNAYSYDSALEWTEAGDTDAFNTYVTQQFSCTKLTSQLLINENGERLNCDKFHVNSTLSVDSAALAAWRESVAFLESERKASGLE